MAPPPLNEFEVAQRNEALWLLHTYKDNEASALNTYFDVKAEAVALGYSEQAASAHAAASAAEVAAALRAEGGLRPVLHPSGNPVARRDLACAELSCLQQASTTFTDLLSEHLQNLELKMAEEDWQATVSEHRSDELHAALSAAVHILTRTLFISSDCA